MDDAQWEARRASLAGQEEPADPDDLELEEDPDCGPPPGLDDAQLAALVAEARELSAEEAAAAVHAARLGTTGALAAIAADRRGPGMPGSARTFPGEFASPAAGFAAGQDLDVAAGCAVLALFAGDAAGDQDRYPGASDDELLGVIAAWDRAEAHMAARKHAAVAELVRRRPAPGCALEGPAQMPAGCDESAAAELASVLAVSRRTADGMLGLAEDLEVLLPGTKAAFRAGILSTYKAGIIAAAVGLLDPAQARAAEALVLDRAGTLTPGGLQAAIARAVMEVAPDKARKRREEAARDARVERWAEASGNASLAGRELPPAQVLAADQRVTWWAQQLKAAGLDGGMDELRARAYLDILLGIDSRPAGDGPGGDAAGGPDQRGGGGAGRGDPGGLPPAAGPAAGMIPPGFAGRVTLTIPLATLLDLAGRPGEIAGIGPVDPALARDLAAAAARNPQSTWCITVTDQDGHAIGHGCARPESKNHRKDPAKRDKPGPPGEHDPPGRTVNTSRAAGAAGAAGPGGTGNRDGPTVGQGSPGFAFTGTDEPGPPGGYGTWRLSTAMPGQPGLLVKIEPFAAGECDHRHQATGHDPGVMLRHLTQVRHATCTAPACRRPAVQCDFEHNVPYEAGGRTCLCNGDPKCRYDHRLKQHPRWKVEQLPDAYVRWTTPSGRQYTTEPTRYPI